jgi:glutathione peroxidase
MRALLLLLCLLFLTRANAVRADRNDSCEAWANQGECEANQPYMLVHCATSCDAVAKAASEGLDGIESFFDLSAKDIDGNAIAFESFRGKVTVLTNVASYCGYTESHYRGLVELWSVMSDKAVEILAFPCNQFGAQEPEEADKIKDFASSKGVRFRIMEKINVNGPNAHQVYKYLKAQAGPPSINWNFGTYFVVGPNGVVESHSGVGPMELRDVVDEILEKEEL